MSNHDGSYMLNDVLNILEQHKVFKKLGKASTLKIVQEIVNLGMGEDGNSGEILEAIGIKLGICYSCTEYAENLDEEGSCSSCG